MAGNSFGDAFRITTFGESHGAAIGVVIDGCPPGLPIAAADIQRDLARRRPGQSRYVTQRRENDEAEILSGIFGGKTTGTPIAMLIRNVDAAARNHYAAIVKISSACPGHAELYLFSQIAGNDYRERRQITAARVAAGAVARVLLSTFMDVWKRCGESTLRWVCRWFCRRKCRIVFRLRHSRAAGLHSAIVRGGGVPNRAEYRRQQSANRAGSRQ